MPNRVRFSKGIPSLILGLTWAMVGSGVQGGVGQTPAGTAQPRAMVAEDYHQLTFLEDPQISPSGREVAFVLRRVTEDRTRRTGEIWTVTTDGTSLPTRVSGSDRTSRPRWSRNGLQLAYLERVPEGEPEAGHWLRALSRDGGTTAALLHLRQGAISDYSWLPDGRILLTLSLDPEVQDPRRAPLPTDPSAPTLTVVQGALYQAEGTGILGPERNHLWILDPSPGALGVVVPRDSRWNDTQAALSPDGRTLVFRRHTGGREYEGAFSRDLLRLPVDAPPGTEPIPFGLPEGRAESPVFAPDGRSILYRFRPGPFARAHLQTLPVAGGPPRTLTLDVDLAPETFFWHPSGRFLYFSADHRGTHVLYRVNANGSDLRPLFGEDGVVSAPSISADGSLLAFLYENEVNPPELWVTDGDGRNPRPLTRFNQTVLAGLEMNRVEELEFLNEAGQLLQGFLVRPVGWTPEGRYPLILNIKGGPGGMWGRRWMPEFQVMAGAGYAVAFVNYRGSSGYGHAFQAAVRRDYGGGDARDNLRLLEEVLSRNPWIDRDRLFLTGGSHGGFLTNWITTETDRFRAAVTQRSVSNWISEAGTQAVPPEIMREEFGGTLWENYNLYWDRSPLSRANRVRTPTLILHSDGDVITPLGQGQEWFYALKALGVPTEMVIFHGEGHELSRSGAPKNLVERIRRILEWFERWDAN
jgi:dipeptidyl aminopeptidase/acylaminoacyl peptidase